MAAILSRPQCVKTKKKKNQEHKGEKEEGRRNEEDFPENGITIFHL